MIDVTHSALYGERYIPAGEICKARQSLPAVRAVATPCRGRTCVPRLDGVAPDGGREACGGGNPVQDHRQSGPQTSDVKFEISIHAALGPRTFDLDQQCVPVMSAANALALRQLCLPWQGFALGQKLDGIMLKEPTVCALRLCVPDDEWFCPTCIELYTDGSAKDARGGSAVIVVAQQNHEVSCRTKFLGYIAGPVELDPSSGLYLGADAADALQAEATAMCWAILWALAHRSVFPSARFVFRFDSMGVGLAAKGQWRPDCKPIVARARQLMQFCEHTWLAQGFLWKHTPAHRGHPWNELADTLAGVCMEGGDSFYHLPVLELAVAVGDVELALASYLPGPWGDNMPRFFEGSINWEQPAGAMTRLRPDQLIPTVPGFDVQLATWKLKIITANLQSGIGKLHYIERQLLEQQVHVAFLQEVKGTRGCIRSRAFLRYDSDSGGHWGCSVWVTRTLPFVNLDGKEMFVDESDISVLTDGPRHVVVKLRTPATSLFLASWHRPAQTRPVEERSEFDNMMANVLEDISGCPCICGIDANGRVPDSFATVTGDIACGEHDDAGRSLASLLARYSCWLPSTFSGCHSGKNETWTHAGGKKSRIDFPLLSSHFGASHVATWVDEDIDLLTACDDHEPVGMLVHLTLPCGTSKPATIDRVKGFDPRKLRQPEVVEQLDTGLMF